MEKLYVAVELGTTTSRLVLGTLQNNCLKLGELSRFPTPILKDKKTQQWDVAAIFQNIVAGLADLGKQDVNLHGISCTGWAGDYLLFAEDGALLSPTFHHDDARSAQGRETVLKKFPAETIYSETGRPIRDASTLLQLSAENSRRLKKARTLLPVADAFNHLLGGVACAENSSASATQLYTPVTKSWSRHLQNELALPPRLLPPIVPAGTRLGILRPDIAKQTHLDHTQIIASCSNELAASLSGLPLNHGRDWAYLRIGSETLIGTEVADPIITAGTQALGYHHETCLGGSTNFYRRANGLFILDECRRFWIERDRELCDDVLLHLATTSGPFEAFIDVTDPRFSEPGDMPLKIQAFCRDSGQEIPRKPGQLIRCVLESLALHYRRLFFETELLTGSRFSRVYLFGANENTLLNHFVVDALQVPAVIASPDAAAIGNIVVQALTLGHIQSLEAAHEILRNSYKIQAIIPHQSDWDTAAERALELTSVPVSAT